jgi:hypothetical protein
MLCFCSSHESICYIVEHGFLLIELITLFFAVQLLVDSAFIIPG